MAYDYDRLYREQPNALGEPTREIVEFFAGLAKSRARVLDLGCGQGRDALFIARLGHRVVGVDLSPAGIAHLVASADREGLDITGEVADVRIWRPSGLFDILLADRTLHMLSEQDRLDALDRLIRHIIPGGFLLIADEPTNIAGFRQVLAASTVTWVTEKDTGGILFSRRAQ